MKAGSRDLSFAHMHYPWGLESPVSTSVSGKQVAGVGATRKTTPAYASGGPPAPDHHLRERHSAACSLTGIRQQGGQIPPAHFAARASAPESDLTTQGWSTTNLS